MVWPLPTDEDYCVSFLGFYYTSVFIQKTFGTCTSLCDVVKPLKVKKLQVSQAMSGF
jgi:hypothetical protein